MQGPSHKAVNLVNGGAQTAYDGMVTLNEFLAWVAKVNSSSTTAEVAAADWTGISGPVPALLQGLPIATIFGNFNLGVVALTSLLNQPVALGNPVTILQAFSIFEELAPVRS